MFKLNLSNYYFLLLFLAFIQVTPVAANEIFAELQLLRSEVSNLRMQIELQQQEIIQLKNAQIDLHQELYQLKNKTNPNIPLVQNNQEHLQLPNNINLNNQAQNINHNSVSDLSQEKKYYDVAFGLVRQRDFAKAKLALQGFIQRFPNGKYISHANYWLGEVYLAENNLNEALIIFLSFAESYPDSPKIPDSLYKLGETYKRLNNINNAQDTWQKLITQYPSSSAAQLAKRELTDN